MYYVITYDIPDDRRRNKIAKILLDFGSRVQYSVFEASLTDKLYEKMLKRIGKHLEESEDRLIVYHICQKCLGVKETFGSGQVLENKDVYII